MVTTILWFLACLGINIILRKQTLLLVGLMITSYVLVPLVSNGFTLVMRPGDYFLISLLGVYLFTQKNIFFVEMQRRPYLAFSVLTTTAFSLVARIVGVGGLGAAFLTVAHIVVFPYLVYLLVASSLRSKPGQEKWLVAVLVPLSFFELLLGWWQYQTGDPIFWDLTFRQQWWWDSGFVITQPVGTFGHWIPYAAFLAMALGISTRVKNRLIWAALIFGTLYIIILTAARSGLLALAIVGLAILIREFKSRSPLKTLVTILMVPLVAYAAANIFASEIGEVLRDKLENDGNSTTFRIEANQWFWANWHDFAFTGLPAGLDLRVAGILNSSLENAFYFYAVAFGMFATALLAITFIMVTWGSFTSKHEEKWTAIFIAVAFGFSAFSYGGFGASEYSTLYIFWIAQAFAQIPSQGKLKVAEETPEEDEKAERSEVKREETSEPPKKKPGTVFAPNPRFSLPKAQHRS